MSNTLILIGAAAVAVALIPLAPKIVWLRIRILRFLRLNWLANWHERHFEGVVIAVRILAAAIAVFLIVLAFLSGSPTVPAVQ